MQEGVVRVDGISQDNLPKNFKALSIQLELELITTLKFFNNNFINPYMGVGLSLIKFDSKDQMMPPMNMKLIY